MKSSDPNIWENDNAKVIFKDIKNIENKINDYDKLEKLLKENEEIYEYVQNSNDNYLLDDLRKEVEVTLNFLIRSVT